MKRVMKPRKNQEKWKKLKKKKLLKKKKITLLKEKEEPLTNK